MRSRGLFLTSVAAGAGAALLAREAGAQTSPPSEAPPAEAPSPKPAASPKRASAVAVATAASMRAFDPELTAADLAAIATGIDENRTGTAALNPKKKRLKNGDGPVTRFSVPTAG